MIGFKKNPITFETDLNFYLCSVGLKHNQNLTVVWDFGAKIATSERVCMRKGINPNMNKRN